jgi:hypothetical protein
VRIIKISRKDLSVPRRRRDTHQPDRLFNNIPPGNIFRIMNRVGDRGRDVTMKLCVLISTDRVEQDSAGGGGSLTNTQIRPDTDVKHGGRSHANYSCQFATSKERRRPSPKQTFILILYSVHSNFIIRDSNRPST